MHSHPFSQPHVSQSDAATTLWSRVRQWIRQEIIDDDPCDQEKMNALRLYEQFRALERTLQSNPESGR